MNVLSTPMKCKCMCYTSVCKPLWKAVHECFLFYENMNFFCNVMKLGNLKQ